MYNQEIKEKFLEEFTAGGRNEKSCRAALEAISRHEDALGVDVARMTLPEIKRALTYVNARTYKSAFAAVTLVRAYVKWCSENKVFSNITPNIIALSVDDIDTSDDFRKILFRNEEEFIKALRSVRPFDDGYFDIIASVFFWLGFSTQQMMEIKIEDVDFENKTVTYDGVSITISDSFCEILQTYAKTKSGTRQSKNGPRLVYRDDSYNTFIRKFSPQNQLGQRLAKSQIEDAVYLLNKAYVSLGNESKFTSGNMIASGALARVYALECSGVDIRSLKNKFIVIDAFRAKAKLHEIHWMYDNYKKAFNL